jgi:cytochrome oxidase Cu insertion factor (SCO1/SenC/PrrC family)
MSPGRRRRLSLALVLLLVGLGGAPATGRSLENALLELQLVPLTGTPTPFTLERLTDGKKVSLAEQRGRPVLLYFWATW